MVLSEGVLRRVIAKADQHTRVACCVASKQLYDAAMHQSVWRRTRVYRLNSCALKFLARVRPESVHLVHSDVRRVEWFLDGMVDEGAHATVKALHLVLGMPTCLRHNVLLECIAEFEALVVLSIDAEDVLKPACLAFPPGCVMRRLAAVKVTERATVQGACRKLEVYFAGADLPALEEVHIRARTSDIMAHARRFPVLTSVTYRSDEDSYEDADLTSVRLALLSVDVRDDYAMHFLMTALSYAGYAERLMLTCHANVCLDTRVTMRHLCIHLRSPAISVHVEHGVVRGLASLTVEVPHCYPSRPFTVRFAGVGSFSNFCAWHQHQTVVRIGTDGVVMVDPR